VGASMPLDLRTLLVRWRNDVVNLPAVAVAASLGVARSALSNWESGRRSPDADALASLDRVFGAGGALVGIASAIGSPQGLPARTIWWHNFPASGGPVWAWVRPGAPGARCGITAQWGVLGIRLDRRLDQRGLILSLPVSVSNPPLRFELDTPGWVDFGPGRIPRSLGIPSVSAAAHLRPMGLEQDPTFAIFASRLRPLIHSPWLNQMTDRLGIARLCDESTEATNSISLAGSGGAPANLSVGSGNDMHETCERPVRWAGAAHRRLREARGLSRAEVAARASALMPDAPVSDDQVHLLESGGHPRVQYLSSRLDVVYRADGQTGLDTVPVALEGGRATVSFPWWWVGPVWIGFTGPGHLAAVSLVWPPWRQQLHLEPGTRVITRKPPGPTLPLAVEVPAGWTVTAGLGYRSDARDVNRGWHSIDRHHADDIFNQYLPLYLQLAGGTLAELRRRLGYPVGDASLGCPP